MEASGGGALAEASPALKAKIDPSVKMPIVLTICLANSGSCLASRTRSHLPEQKGVRFAVNASEIPTQRTRVNMRRYISSIFGQRRGDTRDERRLSTGALNLDKRKRSGCVTFNFVTRRCQTHLQPRARALPRDDGIDGLPQKTPQK